MSDDLSSEIDLSCKEDDVEKINVSNEGVDTKELTERFSKLTRSPDEGDYVLVVFASKEEKYFVSKILEKEDNDGNLQISYLKKTNCDKYFMQPSVPDIQSVNISEIKVILPNHLIQII